MSNKQINAFRLKVKCANLCHIESEMYEGKPKQHQSNKKTKVTHTVKILSGFVMWFLRLLIVMKMLCFVSFIKVVVVLAEL